MGNIQKYYGFKINIIDELDPIRMEAYRKKALKIINMHNFNEDEYFIYLHQLIISPKSTHFGFTGGLAKRLDSIKLSFTINKKQVKNNKIKFFNYLLDTKPNDTNIKSIEHTKTIKYIISGIYLEENLGFKNEIVTFIKKDLKKKHRKVKLSIKATPTIAFSEILSKELSCVLSKIDFKFNKPISLIKPNYKQKTNQFKGTKTVNNTYINYGTTSVMHSENSENTQINQTEIKPKELEQNLATLLNALQENANTPDKKKEVSIVENAHNSVIDGNIQKALEYLKQTGQWTIKISEKIGVPVLTSLIKQQLGV